MSSSQRLRQTTRHNRNTYSYTRVQIQTTENKKTKRKWTNKDIPAHKIGQQGHFAGRSERKGTKQIEHSDCIILIFPRIVLRRDLRCLLNLTKNKKTVQIVHSDCIIVTRRWQR